jgi:hypothetical protein
MCYVVNPYKERAMFVKLESDIGFRTVEYGDTINPKTFYFVN